MNAYARPQTLDEAVALLAEGDRLILSGGTDLYPGAGQHLDRPVLDITGVAGLSGLTFGHGIRIGACTTWTQIAEAEMPLACRALKQAALQVGGRQIQNVGTIGGNICNASPAADGIPPLLAMDASVELVGLSGLRRLPLKDFLLGPRKTARQNAEIVTAIVIPPEALFGKSAFAKLGARAYLVISIAMVAVRVSFEEERVTGAAIAIGACSAVAKRLASVEAALIGASRSEVLSLLDEAQISAELSPITDIRATSEYRQDAAAHLVRTALQEAVA